MDKINGVISILRKLTVFFEKSFWVGAFECVSSEMLSVYKVKCGAEPKDYEIYDFILKKYYQLWFSLAVTTKVNETGYNPKHM